MKTIITTYFLLMFVLFSVKSYSQQVQIITNQGNWQLLLNNKPYFIKGVVGHTYLEKVKEYGGNSVRIGFRKEELDKAHLLGLKALVNLPANSERYGFDYNDTEAVKKQTEKIVEIVQKTKDHPAVMMWAIGNEIDWIPGNKPYNPKLWDAINDAAKAIKRIDPNHPVMTVIGTSSMEKVAEIVKQCPDLDLLGINTYGDIYTLPETLKKYGWNKPFVIAEWGPDGYWEVPKTAWGAPYEQTGREKLDCYEQKYRKAIETGKCLGSYVFYWYHKQETTHTWFSMFNEKGEETPLPKLMKMLWTGGRDVNLAPVADSMNINEFVRYQDIILKAGTAHKAVVTATDPDKDELTFHWEIRPEAVYASYAGQGEKTPDVIQGLIQQQKREISFTTPVEKGAYRLFVYVSDGNKQFSTANLPFLVE
ncbi:MAG: hypothetical protein FD181_3244 [Prolixibacteraceae bacterium]|nr:MAG: hypothetical protein FD181_3244 [Prolixibacteraceae bacterium]